jgi:hypothetical protein
LLFLRLRARAFFLHQALETRLADAEEARAELEAEAEAREQAIHVLELVKARRSAAEMTAE